MKIHNTILFLLALSTTLVPLQAMTVEQYLENRSKHLPRAVFLNEVYVRGMGDGMEAANAAMLFQVLSQFNPSFDQITGLMFYCPPQPPKFPVDKDPKSVYKVILDDAIH